MSERASHRAGSKTAKDGPPARSRFFHVLLALLYLGALSLLIVWEYRERLEAFSSECVLRDETKSSFYNGAYRSLMNWASEPSSTHVVTIAIPEDLEEVQGNICLGRSYLADVLLALKGIAPSVVVVDKFYSAGACAQEPETTDHLLAAVRSLPMPVVIGESTNGTEERAAGACLVRKPQLDFNSSNVRRGLTRLNAEGERLPLTWAVLPETPEPGNHASSSPKPEVVDGLSLAAVRAYDPDFVQQGGVQRLIHKEDHAFANVTINLPMTTTSQILCAAGSDDAKQRWQPKCRPDAALPNMAGRIVLIGAETSTDEKLVLGKRMWGFQLQARYIESLLSGGYLRFLPVAFSFALFAVFVLLIEGVPTILQAYFPQGKRKPFLRYAYPRRRYAWVSFWAVASIAACTAVALSFHYLPPLAAFGDILLVAATRLLYFSAESAEHPLVHTTHHAPRKEHHG